MKRSEGEILQKAYQAVVEGQPLTELSAQALLLGMVNEALNPYQVSAALGAMKTRGESSQELSGFVKGLRQQLGALPRPKGKLLDNCGTGGDQQGTFNISTTAMFVAAAAGVKIAKHGNRAMTSQSGAADILEALGIQLTASPEKVKESIESCGVGFYFAPAYHSAMKAVGPIRKELGFRTLFNLVGPLSNPVKADYQIVGVFSKDVMHLVADGLMALGVERALVVHGSDGLDEITSTGVTYVIETLGHIKMSYEIKPEDFGFKSVSFQALKGDSPHINAKRLIQILKGEGTPEDKTIIAMNAGAAIYLYGCASTLQEGVTLATDILNTSAGYLQLEQFQNAQGITDEFTDEPSILEKICIAKKRRIEDQKNKRPLSEVKAEAIELAKDKSQFHAFKNALSKESPLHKGQKIHVIAEIKQASPSKGILRTSFDPLEIGRAYECAGATAMSVLTEEDYFMGSPETLFNLSQFCKTPLLRKDFIVDVYQIYESKVLGASAILLIAQLLDKEQLKSYVGIAHDLGLDVLLEIHEVSEIDKAIYSGASIIGINNRNLKTFETSIEKSLTCIKHLPSSFIVISESGIQTNQEVETLRCAGFNGVLVGEQLMRSNDVGSALHLLVSKPD